MLRGIDIYKSYGKLEVLKGITIDIPEGKVISLVGTSGAGKSTLLQVLGTLDLPDAGQVWFRDQELTALREKDRAAFRNRKLGFVFQFHYLLPEFSAIENVYMPALINGESRQKAEPYAKELLNYLGLSDRLDHKPSQLSGGEQQRVSVARAMMNKPEIVLADEPTGNLDTRNSEELYKLIFQLAADFKTGFLIATHNEVLASQTDQILRIRDGLLLNEAGI